MNLSKHDQKYMRQALRQAIRGAGFVAPNPMVGAVVVKNDRIVGRGYHLEVGGPHAEVHALEDAGAAARDACLYVTLEPCNHFGRTPPCTQKIVAAGIRRVVSAMADPNPDVAGGGHAYLMERGIEVTCGVCEQQARQVNESYIKYSGTKLPFVILKLAATLDGRIATGSGDARWVTGEAARAKVHEMRHAMDAIMVGIGTVMADDPRLTARLKKGRGRDPIRIILDTRLRLSETARVLEQTSAAVYVVCAADADAAKKQRLIDKGAQILEAPLSAGRIDLAALLKRLGGMGITSVLVEGGAAVAGAALRSDIVDKLALFYAPKLLGSDQGIPMFRGPGPELMKEAPALHHVSVAHLGDDILVTGYRHKRSD